MEWHIQKTSDTIEVLPGTLRTLPVKETLRRACGVAESIGITRVANTTWLDETGIPTCQVIRPLAKSLTVAQGKGLSWELAKASGLMESIETFHAENLPNGRLLPLSKAINSESFLHPFDLPLRVDARIPNSHEVEWLGGTDLATGQDCWIPREMCDLDMTRESRSRRLFRCSSNGLASGNTRSEAVMHGLLEAIESDCIALWRVGAALGGNQSCSRVALESVDDRECITLINQFWRAGLDVAVWDASSDVRVPCFVASVFDSEGRVFFSHRSNGFGCHVAKRIALSRALTEAAQSRVTHIAGARDDMPWSHYTSNLNSLTEKERHRLREVRSAPTPVDYSSLPEGPAFSMTGDLLTWLMLALREAGLTRVAFVDLTREEIGIPVAYTVVPGLEHPSEANAFLPGPRMSRHIENLK